MFQVNISNAQKFIYTTKPDNQNKKFPSPRVLWSTFRERVLPGVTNCKIKARSLGERLGSDFLDPPSIRLGCRYPAVSRSALCYRIPGFLRLGKNLQDHRVQLRRDKLEPAYLWRWNFN